MLYRKVLGQSWRNNSLWVRNSVETQVGLSCCLYLSLNQLVQGYASSYVSSKISLFMYCDRNTMNTKQDDSKASLPCSFFTAELKTLLKSL